MRGQIAELGLEESVLLTGPLDIDEIIHLLTERTQVFALACAVESDGGMDNLPTVLMEAMAASLPCVSTRLAGVPEMVIDGKTGLLCEPNDPVAFARQLATLLDDPGLCEQMGAAGLKHAKARFAQAKTGRALITAFASFGDLRTTPALRARHPWLRSLVLRRLLRKLSTPQINHQPAKVSGKTFDLDRFIQG